MGHRSAVGPGEDWDISGAMQLHNLVRVGLRGKHKMLDFFCGSLRAGRFFLQYMEPGNYYGYEPFSELVDEGIREEIGTDILKIKSPHIITGHVKGVTEKDFKRVFPGTHFDYIIAQSVFTHTGLDFMEIGLKNLLAACDILVFTVFLDNTDSMNLGWLYPPLSPGRAAYRIETIKKFAPTAVVKNWAHPNEQTWLVCGE